MESNKSNKKRKVMFHINDTVKLKGVPFDQSPSMRVTGIIWDTNPDGSLKKRVVELENGEKVENNVLKGIQCGWYTKYTDPMGHTTEGEYIEKNFDSRDLVKESRTGEYYLQLAKDALYGNTEIIKRINEILEML
jgi:hypothetical protein